jgi:cell division inhibitor SepF
MALKDSWHRVLVYFGLAEETHGDYGDDLAPDYPEDDFVESERNGRGKVRRLPTGGRRSHRDDIEDIFPEEDDPRGRARVLHPVADDDVQVHLVVPRNFNDAQQVADQFKRGVPVILNLQTTDHDLSKRLIDFGSGLTYALDGGMQRIAEKTFLLTPRNVEVSAEEKARLIDKGFFNQS